MSIADIILMSDTDTSYTMGVGSIVVPVDFNKRALKAPSVPDTVVMPDYGFAIVVSMSPFTLVSERGDMRWQTTVNPTDFRAVGKASDDAMVVCNKRLNG
jgi:hypothetical protein